MRALERQRGSLVLAPLSEQKRIADKLDAVLAGGRLPSASTACPPSSSASAKPSSPPPPGKLTRRSEQGSEVDDWHLPSAAKLRSRVFDGPFGSRSK
jgi:hypothetical protein